MFEVVCIFGQLLRITLSWYATCSLNTGGWHCKHTLLIALLSTLVISSPDSQTSNLARYTARQVVLLPRSSTHSAAIEGRPLSWQEPTVTNTHQTFRPWRPKTRLHYIIVHDPGELQDLYFWDPILRRICNPSNITSSNLTCAGELQPSLHLWAEPSKELQEAVRCNSK